VCYSRREQRWLRETAAGSAAASAVGDGVNRPHGDALQLVLDGGEGIPVISTSGEVLSGNFLFGNSTSR
jgi:hypothetical protein